MSGGVPSVVELAELLSVPVCTTYLHNDAFPASHRLSLGPLGYQVRGPQRCLELDALLKSSQRIFFVKMDHGGSLVAKRQKSRNLFMNIKSSSGLQGRDADDL